METLQIEKAPPDLSFPLRLYILVRDAEDEFPAVISWVSSSNGTAFQVHDADELEKSILPKYFKSSIKFSSFRRQLLGYGFQCIGKLQYKHDLFQRGNAEACERISRVKTKPKRNKATKIPLSQQHPTGTAVPELANEITAQHPVKPVNVFSAHLEGMKNLLTLNFNKAAAAAQEQPQTLPTPPFLPEQVEDVFDDFDDGSADYEPIPYSPITDYDSSPASSPDSSMRGSVARNVISPLEGLWCNLMDNMQEDLEPRSIQAMVEKPNIWHTHTPTMAPSQQAWLEFTMAGSLPGIFFSFGVNTKAHVVGLVHILCHSGICCLTNFGGGAWHIDGFGPLQHVGWDMVLNQGLNSVLLLLGPAVFGAGAYPLTLFLVFANNFTLPMNYKIHFEEFIEKSNRADATTTKYLQHKLGGHIRRIIVSALIIVALLATACYFGNSTTLTLSVFVYNLLPFWVDLSYWLSFSKELRQLPAKNRNILADERFTFLRPQRKEKKA